MVNITDKERIDWLQSGHGVVSLSKPGGRRVFSANFEEQGWDEYEDVREAIDAAILKKKNSCPICGNDRQVWRNQITKKLTCHRYGCNNAEI